MDSVYLICIFLKETNIMCISKLFEKFENLIERII